VTLSNGEMRAHSIEELAAALNKVKFCRWDHEAI
jgi:hypothetical protein